MQAITQTSPSGLAALQALFAGVPDPEPQKDAVEALNELFNGMPKTMRFRGRNKRRLINVDVKVKKHRDIAPDVKQITEAGQLGFMEMAAQAFAGAILAKVG